MILYHGTNLDIEHIDLNLCRNYKDFGKGFYTTEIYEQAEKMSKRVARIYGGSPIINVYEIEDNFMLSSDLNILDFGKTVSERWARFIMNNRNRNFKDFSDSDCNFDFKYDIVGGPIADDNMTMLFRQLQNNMITFDMLIKGMTFKDVTSQYSFHTKKAIQLLRKVGNEK